MPGCIVHDGFYAIPMAGIQPGATISKIIKIRHFKCLVAVQLSSPGREEGEKTQPDKLNHHWLKRNRGWKRFEVVKRPHDINRFQTNTS